MAVLEHSTSSIDQRSVVEAGWHPDPEARHHLRYFDGLIWTEHVTHYGPSPCSGCGQTDDETSSS